MTLNLILYIFSSLFILYTIGVMIFIITENRTPQSTFAWLLLFLAFPGIGVAVYLFLGRGHHTFSKEQTIARQELGSDLLQDIGPLIHRQQATIEKLAQDKPASYKKRLLRLIHKNSGSLLTAYNQVEILQDATEKYPRLLADIKAAQHYIHLNYYIWTEDDFTLEIKAALLERAQAGIEVRCLFDAMGGAMSQQYLQDLTAGGVEIHPYLEYRKFTTLHNANYRSHRKIAIIDGKIGYVGGLNLDKEQMEPPAFDTWRDTHLRIVGEAAHALQVSFVISWFNTTNKKINGPQYYPNAGVTEFMPVQITQGGPDSQWKAIRQLYFLMIMAAEDKIYMQSPFFIPDESITEALKAAALSGVEVKLMFTPRGSTYQIPYRAAHTYYKEVVEAGAEVYLYKDGYFHPKTLNIDNAVITIGTANMDIRSFNLNYETQAIVYDTEKAKELEAQFLEDLKHCEKWSLEAYKEFSFFHRFVDSVYRLASPVL